MGEFSPVKVGYLKEVGIVMSAKENAIEICGAVPIARHINDDRFSVGWYTDRLYETGVGSKVDDEGLFFWADTGYGDCDNPCWEWENKPYAEGLMHAFHKEVSSVLCEGIPFADTRFSSPTQEFEVFKQLFGRITINGQAVLNNLGDCGFGGVVSFYRSVDVPRVVVCLDIANSHMVRLYDDANKRYSKELTCNLSEDMDDLLVGMFDMIDTQAMIDGAVLRIRKVSK